MVKIVRFLLLTAFSLSGLWFYAVATAAVPTQMNFQGILLDDDGGTVRDSTYDLVFRIFDDPTIGAELWTEPQTVTTENGLFNTFLGKNIPVPGDVFDEPTRWLEIELVGSGPYAPRNPIGSVAYAFRVESVNGATGGSIYGDIQLHSTLTIGDLSGHSGVLQLTDGNGVTLVLDGANVGSLWPDSIITSAEITNESGIAADFQGASVTLLQGSASMTDLVTVTITTPSDGYIFLQGRCVFRAEGSLWQNAVRVQIDEAAGGAEDPVHYSEAGSYDDPSLLGTTGTSASFNLTKTIYTDRVYYKPAGTHTFRLEGMTNLDNSPSAVSKIRNAFLTATFHPTSYGSVATTVTAGESGAFQDASLVPGNIEDGSNADGPVYRVDLRELELKAARLQAELERTKRELAERKLEQQ